VRDGDGVEGDPSHASAKLDRLGVDIIVIDAIRLSMAHR
jgi:hypothetical protein